MIMRPAEQSDGPFLYNLRNDPLVREMSQNTQLIDYPQHRRWFDERVKHPGLFIADDWLAQRRIGMLRIDDGVVSYAVTKEYRGHGYATLMLTWAHVHYGTLEAVIKKDNVASIKAATKTGHRVVLID
jgi:RimJ/RimL family protein N-acetyltransferase